MNFDLSALNIFQSIEEKFNKREYAEAWVQWLGDNWLYSVYASAIYIAATFAIQYYMRERKKHDLRALLIAWNIFLSIFSIIGTIKMLPSLINVLVNDGFEDTICKRDFIYGATGFWSLLFVFSKYFELGDTFFIVSRKQKLIFLHWYHHATVLIFTVYSNYQFCASSRWYMTMNYLVHSVMYTYYALKAMRINITPIIPQIITIMQLSQMFIGCYVNYRSYMLLPLKGKNSSCFVSYDNIKYSSLMYFTYFILFLDYFVYSYIGKRHSSYHQLDKKKDSIKVKKN